MCSDATLKPNGTRTQGRIKRILSYAMFIGLLLLLTRLGFWQLARGHEREKLELSYVARQQHILSFNQLIKAADGGRVTGTRTEVKLTPTKAPLVMLDNQIVRGKVGYLVYQLMRVSPDKPWLPVELGFISAYSQRSRLPVIEPIMQTTTLTGRVYHTSANPFSRALMPESGNPLRVQNLNYRQLGKLLGHPVLTFALQPERTFQTQDGRELSKPWRPIAMSSSKNYGYAIQWFAMATALAVIGAIVIYKKRKK